MTRVYWSEQCLQDVPSHTRWLSAQEAMRADALRVAKRRSEWLLGRWTAKRAVALCLALEVTPPILSTIEITSGADGAPAMRINGSPASVGISISHRAGMSLCAVAPSGNALGCDLEAIEAHSLNFLADYFTTEEQGFVWQSNAVRRAEIVALLWSAKESVLKLIHTGLRLDTRTVSVTLPEAGCEHSGGGEWSVFHALFETGALFRGWWQSTGTTVRTVAAFPPVSSAPIQLVER